MVPACRYGIALPEYFRGGLNFTDVMSSCPFVRWKEYGNSYKIISYRLVNLKYNNHMKQLRLPTHIALKRKMHEFAGFNMPIEYSGIIDEHMTVVNGVGVFDVSHDGRVLGKRPERMAFIQSELPALTLLSCRLARLNILASRMTREVSWMTFWYIITSRRNICWSRKRPVISTRIGIGA